MCARAYVCVLRFQSQKDDESHQSKDITLQKELSNECKTVAALAKKLWYFCVSGNVSDGLHYSARGC